MLILTRKCGETIVVDDDTVFTVLEFQGGSRVRVGVTAPGATILRGEVYEEQKQEQAAQTRDGPRAASARHRLAQELAQSVVRCTDTPVSSAVLTQILKTGLPADRVELYAEMKAAGRDAGPGQQEHNKIQRLRNLLEMTGRQFTFSDLLDRAAELIEDLHTMQAAGRKAAAE